jgi:hypothetical protein
MKELLDKILKYLPHYLTDFGTAFAGPKSFIAAKLSNAEDDAFAEALLFLGISFALVVLMLMPLQRPGTDFWSVCGTNFITALIGMSLGATVTRVAWWIVGGRAPARLFFIAYAYLIGVVYVILAAVQLLSMGFFKVLDPQLYRQFLDASQKGQSMPDLSQSYIPVTALAIFIFGWLALSIWAFIGWGAYRQLNGLSKLRSFIALLILGILMLPVTAITFFVASAMS